MTFRSRLLTGLLSVGSLVLFATPVAAHTSTVPATAARTNAAYVAAPAAKPVVAETANACGSYTVVPGDTLSNIAANYGTTWQTLAAINRIPDANLIFPGQVFALCGNAPAQQAQVQQAAPVQSAPAVATSGGSVQDIINQTFGGYAWQAQRVAACESGFNPNAVNYSSDAEGVFQFLYGTWVGTPYAGYSRQNAWANVQAAWYVFQRDGYSWREWSCKP